MNLVMKFYDKEDFKRTLEIEICENGILTFIRTDKEHEYPDEFQLEESEANKFFSDILKLKDIARFKNES